jgi:hypothetical protein
MKTVFIRYPSWPPRGLAVLDRQDSGNGDASEGKGRDLAFTCGARDTYPERLHRKVTRV